MSSAYAGKLLISKFGNPNHGSILRVSEGGLIHHSERICCPEKIESVREPKMTPSQLEELKLLADRILRARTETRRIPVTADAIVGAILAYDPSARSHIVRYVKKIDEKTLEITTSTDTEAVSKIEAFVRGIVRHSP